MGPGILLRVAPERRSSEGGKILHTPNLACDNKDTIIHALILYDEKRIDYIDAYNACILSTKGISELYSHDKHHDRLNRLKRIEPNG